MVPYYYVWSSRVDGIESRMIFRLPSSFVNVFSHFSFHNIAEKRRMNLVLAVISFNRLIEVYRSSPGCAYKFIRYDFATGTVLVYPAGRPAPVQRENVRMWFFDAYVRTCC